MPPKLLLFQRVSDNFGSLFYPAPVTSQISSPLTLEQAVLLSGSKSKQRELERQLPYALEQHLRQLNALNQLNFEHEQLNARNAVVMRFSFLI